MKTLKQYKNKIALTLAALSCVFTAHAAFAGETVELNSKDYIRVTIPAESAEQAVMIYAVNDSKTDFHPTNGEVVTLHAEKDGVLGKIRFSAVKDGEGSFMLQMGLTDPIGLDQYLHFSSTDEALIFQDAAPIYVQAPGITMEVVQSGNPDEIINQAPVPLAIDENSQDFSKLGFLEMRFVVQAAPENDPPADPNDGLNQDNPEVQPSAGGCSMLPGATESNAFGAAALGLFSSLFLVLRRGALKK